MRRLAFALAFAVLIPGTALADQLDFHLYQLGNPATDPSANARFNAFVNELGVSIANWNLEPPETTGFSGFNFAFEYPVSLINDSGTLNGVRYWPIEGAPHGAMQMPGIHVRKGFPFSFEAGAKVNYLTMSNMVAATVEAKWALNEGFIYFPDIGVRGFGTQLIGARDFTLTAAGFDLGIGKQLPINGQMTFTPYAGWRSVWVAASSNIIDFRPDQTEPSQFSSGASGTGSTNVFDSVSLGDNRTNCFYGGVRLISYIVEFGLEASYGLVKTDHTDYTIATYSAKLGLDF